MLEATLKLMETKLGPDHPETLNSRHNLAEQPTSRSADGPRPSDCIATC